MATHPDIKSMLYESLPEMLLVAKYCIEYRKDKNIWSVSGCYGYPAALLLLSIVDSIGSYIENGKGNIDKRFKVLNNDVYYGLNLTDQELQKIRRYYRDLLSHNTVIAPTVGLSIGSAEDAIFEEREGRSWLNLVPFYNISVKAVNVLLNNPDILNNNNTILNINRKT